MPSFLIATTFLDQPCGLGATHGVNPEMRIRLQAAEAAVRAAFDALSPDRRIDPSTGLGNASFSQWCAISGPLLCWRANADHHSAGSAVDIDPAANPYIVTRNGPGPGPGRAADDNAAGPADARARALAAYDRAVQFTLTPADAAGVSERQPNESTPSVWTRFKAVSDALERYLRFAVDSGPTEVSRVAIENADDIGDDELLATIPQGERLELDSALAQLDELLGSQDFQASHPAWPNDARAQYSRILRDYEHARVSMVSADPGAAPGTTGNPARGFLALRSEIVTALCDQGLRWGACDFKTRRDGTSQNGAMMHFDLADDGGYPEIHSLLRFG